MIIASHDFPWFPTCSVGIKRLGIKLGHFHSPSMEYWKYGQGITKFLFCHISVLVLDIWQHNNVSRQSSIEQWRKMPGTLLLPPCMGTYTSYSCTIPQTDTKMLTYTFTCTAHIRGGRLYEAYSFFCKLDMLVYLFIYLFICVTRLLEICFIDKTRRPKRTKQGLCS